MEGREADEELASFARALGHPARVRIMRLLTRRSARICAAAIAATLPGASWQRCRTHFVCNLRTPVPRSAQSFVATIVRSIFAQPSADEVWAQHSRVVEQLGAHDGADDDEQKDPKGLRVAV